MKSSHHQPQLMLLNPIPSTKKASRPDTQTAVNVPPNNMDNGTTLEGKTISRVGGVVIKGAGMNGSVGCRDCIGDCTGEMKRIREQKITWRLKLCRGLYL